MLLALFIDIEYGRAHAALKLLKGVNEVLVGRLQYLRGLNHKLSLLFRFFPEGQHKDVPVREIFVEGRARDMVLLEIKLEPRFKFHLILQLYLEVIVFAVGPGQRINLDPVFFLVSSLLEERALKLNRSFA